MINHTANQEAPQKKRKRQTDLEIALNKLLVKANGQDIEVETLLSTLTGKGQAVLLILFSLPFCQPLIIPGFSIPFGLGVIFIGLRLAFGHHMWLPQTILKKKISYESLQKIVKATLKIVSKFHFLLSIRLSSLVQYPPLHVIHGLTIVILGALLALPFPIPLGNMLVAYPILAFGLAFLSNDGLFIIIAYLLTLLNFLVLGLFIWLGEAGLKALLNYS